MKSFKYLCLLVLFFLPIVSGATGLNLLQGGLGTTTVPTGWVMFGLNTNRIQASSTLFISTAGNVGIGTTSPNVLLTVGGSNATGAANGLNFSGDVLANLYRTMAGAIKTDGMLYVGNTLYVGTGGNGIGSSAGVSYTQFAMGHSAGAATISRNIGDAYSALVINQANSSSIGDILDLRSQGVTKVSVLNNGNVGIGTTTPPSIFSVMNETATLGLLGTTTVDFGDYATTSSKTCFNTKNTAGTAISFYFIGTSMIVENNRCR